MKNLQVQGTNLSWNLQLKAGHPNFIWAPAGLPSSRKVTGFHISEAGNPLVKIKFSWFIRSWLNYPIRLKSQGRKNICLHWQPQPPSPFLEESGTCCRAVFDASLLLFHTGNLYGRNWTQHTSCFSLSWPVYRHHNIGEF